MRLLYLLSIIFLLIPDLVKGQVDITIGRKEFKKEKQGFDVAWKHLKAGDSYYIKGGIWYKDAFNEYKQAYTYNQDSPGLNYKIGISCLYSDKKDEASGFLLKAFELKNDVAEDILLVTGQALMYAGKYSSAVEKFNGFLSSTSRKSEKNITHAKKCIEECNVALLVTKDTLTIEISNPGGNVNSSSDDYSVVLTPNGKKMLFASRRALTGSSQKHYDDTKYDENIYASNFISGGLSPAVLLDKSLITEFCETPLFMSNDTSKLYIYAGFEGDGDILVSNLKKGKWSVPKPVTFNINTKFPETSFAISPKGDEMVFVSNRSNDGLGGKDVYILKELKGQKWSKPVNIGTAINTRYDEESVKFSAGGDTLWFASRGHNSIGGFDIFYSVRNTDGSWNQAVNAGYPINTAWNELFYTPSPEGNGVFYFVSDRSGGLGGLDIYKGLFLSPPAQPEQVVVPLNVKIEK